MTGGAPDRGSLGFWVNVRHHWMNPYSSTQGVPGVHPFSERSYAVEDLFDEVLGLIVPADMGGTPAEEALGRKLAELLIDADADGRRRSVLRAKDIVLLREILVLFGDALIPSAPEET